MSNENELKASLRGIKSALNELEIERGKGMLDIGRYLQLKEKLETRKAKLEDELDSLARNQRATATTLSERLITLDKHLKQARSFKDQDRFDEALSVLREARKLASTTDEDQEQINAVEDKIEQYRQGRVQALSDELDALARKSAKEMTKADLDTGQAALARLQGIHPNPTDLEPLAERWNSKRCRAEMLQDLNATHRELNALWESSYILLSSYDRALALVRQKVAEHFDEPSFQELLVEAEKRRHEAYDRSGELTTQAAEGNFEYLITELERLYAQGYEQLPWYEWGTEEIEGETKRTPVASIRDVSAQEAVARIKELAAENADSKADKYIHQARGALPENPYLAEELVKGAREFKYLSLSKRAALETFYNEVVEPALEKREQANVIVNEARQKSREDIKQAWELLAEAEKVDSHAIEISQSRHEMRPLIRWSLENELEQAKKHLQAGEIENAIGIVKDVYRVVRADEELEKNLGDLVRKLAKECDVVKK